MFDGFIPVHITSEMSGHLQLAYSYTHEAWFPVLDETLRLVQRGLQDGTYLDAPTRLLPDLKRDFALFTFALGTLARELRAAMPANEIVAVNPLQHLTSPKAVTILKGALLKPDSALPFLSRHNLSQATTAQSRCLQHAIVSATVAETLAVDESLVPDAVFASALLRQLGLTLVAWNYPHVFSRALKNLKPGETVDAILGKKLGFSPRMLAVYVSQQWGLVPEMRGVIGDQLARDSIEARTPLGERVKQIEKLCKIGEAFARANDPHGTPVSETEWQTVKSQIKEYLGPDGMSLLKQRLLPALDVYAQVTPSFVSEPPRLKDVWIAKAEDPRKPRALPAIPTPAEKAVPHQNEYLAAVPDELRAELLTLYRKLDARSPQQELIQHFAHNVVTVARFARGCIYLFEPDTRTLTPRFSFGDTRIQDLPAVAATSSTPTGPIANAFVSRSLLSGVVSHPLPRGLQSYFAAAIGESTRFGVLYLEYDRASQPLDDKSTVIRFKALRQALNDVIQVI